jgi:mediator of RNA polymerase II transcription subunit 12
LTTLPSQLSLRSAKSQSLPPAAQQGAATQASATYSTDFINAFAAFLKSQLAQLTVPSTLPSVLRASTTFSVKSTFKSLLSVPASRERWLKKWSYSNRLLQACQLPEHALIDRRALLSWIVAHVGSANLAQIGFVAKLLEEYSRWLHLDGSLSRGFLDAALGRLAGDLAGKKELEATVARLSKVIQCLFLGAPHFFVSPRLYLQHLGQLDQLLSTATAGQGMLPPFIARDDPVAHEILSAMGDAWESIKIRNEGLLFRSWGVGGGKGVWSERKGTLGDIWILDSVTALSDMARITKAFFGSLSQPPSSSASAASAVTGTDTAAGSSGSPASEVGGSSTLREAFAVKLDILLSWATAKPALRSRTAKAQRSYAVATILSLFLATRVDLGPRPADGWLTVVQDEVFGWIEDSALARDEDNVEIVADVVGELARRSVISYPAYLMRLIARGQTWSAVGRDVAQVRRSFSIAAARLLFSFWPADDSRTNSRASPFPTSSASSVRCHSFRRRSRFGISVTSSCTGMPSTRPILRPGIPRACSSRARAS